MKLVRFVYQGAEALGTLKGEEISLCEGSLFGELKETGMVIKAAEVHFLPPVKPEKVLCVGLNYMDHVVESKVEKPELPVIFSKGPGTVIGARDEIRYPVKMSKRVDYEGELAVVIGKTARDVEEGEAAAYILGYTCANDVTARDLQTDINQWTVAKGFDTFCPLGPCIATDLDPGNLEIRLTLNGEERQHSNTRHLLFKPTYLVSYLSHIFELHPGDVILTGTPEGIGPMEIGDMVTVEIEGIGALTNVVGKR
ncbi:MAG: fumarylacetoacetate hydrolase family protein [Lachnospiraceae bacterium]|nr:fumarylacetoacetate hydrolase family protein [Lachnospiraceae bacterium]